MGVFPNNEFHSLAIDPSSPDKTGIILMFAITKKNPTFPNPKQIIF